TAAARRSCRAARRATARERHATRPDPRPAVPRSPSGWRSPTGRPRPSRTAARGRTVQSPARGATAANACSRPGGDLLVDVRDLPHEPLPDRVLHVEDLLEVPVEVVGDVRDLAIQRVRCVRHDSPRRPPARSTVISVWQLGQVTNAFVWPSVLIR